MPNVKISAAADAGTLLSSDMLPLARSGDTNAYHCTMAEVATFASVTASSASYNNVGRNLLHNPTFLFAQRGAGPFTATGYCLDRWINAFGSGDACTIGQAAASDANRASIGDEAAVYLLDCTFTGASGASNFVGVQQKIEEVNRLSGKTVTVSFYANATVASLKVGVSLDQFFGTGGSPSATVQGTGQAVTLSATAGTFTRNSLTFTLPSMAGKTRGTNNDDCTVLNLWLSAGTSSATRAGSIGVQSGTINFWGMQLEVGSTATPLAKRDVADDFLLLQRFYCAVGGTFGGYSPAAGAITTGFVSFPVPMRAVPIMTLTPSGGSNYSTVAAADATVCGFTLVPTVSAAGLFSFQFASTASADL